MSEREVKEAARAALFMLVAAVILLAAASYPSAAKEVAGVILITSLVLGATIVIKAASGFGERNGDKQ